MGLTEKIGDAQTALKEGKLDGWLLYDFRKMNDLAFRFLEMPEMLFTRRFFYWIPAKGDPIKIVHAIEDQALAHLPGTTVRYRTWEELELNLKSILAGNKRIAMEYSPKNAIPTVSKVDAGTVELIRSFHVNVVSSCDLLQRYTAVWDEGKLKSHLFAARQLDSIVEKTWGHIAKHLDKGITEYDAQQFILKEFEACGCMSDDPPICAVNANSANPHYAPLKNNSREIKQGDFILLDLWCKQKEKNAVYADITRVGVAAKAPTIKQQKIFEIVKLARDQATALVKERFASGKQIRGYEVDDAARQVIAKAGFGEFFIHRTGHNIDLTDHGPGANMDHYETVDERMILKGTCFSIEPGIYLPGEFGVRLEYDVFIHPDGKVQVTGGIQENINTI